ncbi:hypothetical protein I552_7559 [Mycobacterium xenopi 3993]|nr:hypothetical protein I552_7559 [Mycobacterium xenopi 3993]
MDTVLGVSMAPTTVRMVLVEGENADGSTVDEENFELSHGDESAPRRHPIRLFPRSWAPEKARPKPDISCARSG